MVKEDDDRYDKPKYMDHTIEHRKEEVTIGGDV